MRSTTLLLLFVLSAGKLLKWSNMVPKFDVKGNIMDAHDGTIRKYGQFWYYHAAQYGLCTEPLANGCDMTPDRCGFQDSHNVTIWRSPDLTSGSWEYVGLGMVCRELPDCGIMYRPQLVYNPTTRNYTLFVNYVRKSGGYGGYAVYTSASPEGPFDLRVGTMNITRLCPSAIAPAPCGEAQGGAGDYTVFVDDDGQGYLLYGANYYMSIEKLTPDFLWSTGKNASCGGKFNGTVFPDYFVEAPVMFKRDGLYYILYGHCCCFCYQGSGVLVYTAPHPMGPWTAQTSSDLACVPPTDPLHSSGYQRLGGASNGPCRDWTGVEPSSYANNGMITADECAAYCTAMDGCHGFSYCTDKCPGACQMYVEPPYTAPDRSTNWVLTTRTGDAKHITEIVANQTWWRCYVKSQAGEQSNEALEHPNSSIERGGSPTQHFTTPEYHRQGFQGQPTGGQGCLYAAPFLISTTRAQQNFVIEVPLSDGSTAYVWTGDRWQQSPDSIKGHEGQFWGPLQWNKTVLQPLLWVDEFSLDVA